MLLAKRVGLAVISLAVGFVLTWLIVELVGTNLWEYGSIYTFFTALSLGCALAIWLDKFMGTDILPK